jgi:hypothetical protein
MAGGKPDFKTTTIAPQVDPWFNARLGNGPGTDFSRPGQLGNAWTDQFNSSLMGQEPYHDPNEGNVYRGAIDSSGRKVESDGDPTPPEPTSESDGAPAPRDITGPPIPSRNFPNTAPLAPAITPDRRINPNPQGVMTSVPWAAPRNAYEDERGRIRYEAPPSFGRRLGRMAGGFVKGVDTGNSKINWAQPVVRKLLPASNLPLGAAGAVQGFRSNKPMTRTWNPNDPENQQLPAGQTRQVPPASQAALNQVLSDPSSAPHTQDSGGYVPNGGDYNNPSYMDPSYNGYQAPPTWTGNYPHAVPPTGGTPEPTPTGPAPGPPAATTPSSSPLPTVPATTPPAGHTAPPATGGTTPPPTAQPRPANPENRVNPQTGEPDPNGVLPQHMPGYVPPTYIPFTQDGVKAINALYQKYYGRDATPEEARAHTGNPGGIKAVEAALKAAPDAKPQTTPPTTNTPPGSPAETAAVAAATGAGSGGGGYSYAGFDFAQDPANRDITKSAKYAFSHFAGQAAASGAPQPRSKAEAQAWFEKYIAPGMNANGFKVHKVVGDKAFISTRERPNGQWIDFQGNSGGQGDQPLTWQAENGGQGGDANPEDIFAVQDFGGGGSGSSLGNSDPGGVLDSGNSALNSFARSLISRLLEGQALEDALSEETRRTGISQQSLGAVGF